MPTYEYKCNNCDKHFDKFLRTTADVTVNCPFCDSTNVERLISGGLGFIFKGSGFYATDYARKGISDLPDEVKSKSSSSTSSTGTDAKSKEATKAN